MRGLLAALIVAVMLLMGAVAWTGAELHYDNCVSDVNGRYPVVVDRRRSGEPFDVNEPRRRRALDQCSRLPF
jgi:hypothetical protein